MGRPKRDFIKCSVAECNKNVYAFKICKMHYARFKNHGSLDKSIKKLSAEHFRKLREGLKRYGYGMTGKHHSEETKKRMSLNSPKFFLGKKFSPEHIKNLSESHIRLYKNGYKNPNLKENPSYRSLHSWVDRHLGKPKLCSLCGQNDITKRYHWANIGHTYKRVKTDWIRVCVKCHKAFDKQQKGTVLLKSIKT